MSAQHRRVVVTGLGVLSACGVGADALWGACAQRRSGLHELPYPGLPDIPVPALGYIENFEPTGLIKNRKSLKVMCRDIQLAVAASTLALRDSGLTPDSMRPGRSGVVVGAGIFEQDPEEMADSFRVSFDSKGNFDPVKFGAEGISRLFPLWLLKYLPNMPACHITIEHNLQGPSNTLTGESGGTAEAIGEAARIIARGRAEVMFAGGAQAQRFGASILRLGDRGLLKTERGGGLYPVFGADSSGVVLGEGGAFLVLEEYEHAAGRGARIYAELLAAVTAGDAPPGAGSGVSKASGGDASVRYELTIREALAEAGIGSDRVDAVHLSARGIREEEAAEAAALKRLFGAHSHKPVLAATKPLTGFTGFAAAPVEAALACLSLGRGACAESFEGEEPLLSGEFNFSSKKTHSGSTVLVNHIEGGLSSHAFILAKPGVSK